MNAKGNNRSSDSENDSLDRSSKSSRSLLGRIFVFCVAVFGFWLILEASSWAIIRIYAALTADQREEAAQKILIENIGSPLYHPLWACFRDTHRAAGLARYRTASPMSRGVPAPIG